MSASVFVSCPRLGVHLRFPALTYKAFPNLLVHTPAFPPLITPSFHCLRATFALRLGHLHSSFSSLSCSYLLHQSAMPPSSVVTLRNSLLYDRYFSHLTSDRCTSANGNAANPTVIPSHTFHPSLIAIRGAFFDLSGHHYFQGIGPLQCHIPLRLSTTPSWLLYR